jgi:hypothetical protein
MLTIDDFTPHIGTEFIARAGDFEDRLTLVEAAPSRAPAREGTRQGFSLVFEGIRDDEIITNMIEVDHPVIGPQLLTPSALGPGATGGFRYEVVFN